MKRMTALVFLIFAASCGSRPMDTDESGLIREESDITAFARASQLYFRGNLSRARDGFNAIIYRYPDSVLGEDAALAARRIDQDLGSTRQVDSGRAPSRGVESAVCLWPSESRRYDQRRSERGGSAFNA